MIVSDELEVPCFSGAFFDRASSQREDPDLLRGMLAAPGTRILLYWRERLLVKESRNGFQLSLLRTRDLSHFLETDNVLFVGSVNGNMILSVDVSKVPRVGTRSLAEGFGSFRGLGQIAMSLSRTEAAVAGYARSMWEWHSRTHFCGSCGGQVEFLSGGHVKRCLKKSCRKIFFPRVDPVVLMLVAKEDSLLLARRIGWPKTRYGILAGFVEPGERLEEAVRREAFEEVGVEIIRIQYCGSQPWPFPASLMIGFVVEASSYSIRVEGGELEDARWFEKTDLVNRGKRGITLPSQLSMARQMIDAWIAQPGGRLTPLQQEKLSALSRVL